METITKEKNKNNDIFKIKAWNRTWIMAFFAILSLILGLAVLNNSGVYNLEINRPANRYDMKFDLVKTILISTNILVTIGYLVVNFVKGMTKKLYSGFIYYYVFFVFANLFIFNFSLLIFSILLGITMVLLSAYIAGQMVKRFPIGAIFILPTTIIYTYLVYVFTYANMLNK